ncbi:hypothetical protein [Parabacteroides sp. TM07-1AC]|uniref:hypothetical protein n=1 Tax=Parabacteroides sp. TM07-1AC TaxID=2292363 RepID=UPI0011C3707B|nr:hypothetical protein [Parabacteroides sp. TM07-1AC]
MKCFIIMPFDDEFNEIYDFYIRACESRGIEAQRVSSKGDADVLKKIFRHIKESDITIVDISNYNPNVFYEFGYYHGHHDSTDNIIFTLNEKVQVDKLPFDIRNLSVLSYDDMKVFSHKFNIKLDSLKDPKTNPNNCIKLFYKNISEKEYNEAWNFLSMDFKRRRFNNCYKLFKSGYNSHRMFHLNIKEIERDNDAVKYYVTYISESEVPVIEGFPISRKNTIKEIKKIRRDFELLKRNINEKGFDSSFIDDLTFKEAIAANSGDILLFYLKRQQNIFSNEKIIEKCIYKKTETARLSNAYEVTVCREKKYWYVTKIIPV